MAAGSALKKINARVKHLCKIHPGAKRVTLQKQAGREYREGKLGRVATKKVHKKTAHKKVHSKKVGATREVGKDRVDNKRVHITVGSITKAQHMAALKKAYQQDIAFQMVRKITTATKTGKRKIQRKINELNKEYRKLL